jgi:hypothetical protein
MSALAIGLFIGACDPLVSSVVELSTRDGSVSRPAMKDARVAPPPVDPSDDKDGNAVELEPPAPDDCLVLVDQTIAEVVTDAAVVEGRFVQSRTATAAGCADPDAGPQYLNASVFWRRDGKPLVERGGHYSYRWMSDTAMNRVRLQGGDRACAEETVVDFAHGLQLAALGVASCYEFDSPIEAHYLRTTATDYISPWTWATLGTKPVELRLCSASCPAGTAHDFMTDGGTPDAAKP